MQQKKFFLKNSKNRKRNKTKQKTNKKRTSPERRGKPISQCFSESRRRVKKKYIPLPKTVFKDLKMFSPPHLERPSKNSDQSDVMSAVRNTSDVSLEIGVYMNFRC